MPDDLFFNGVNGATGEYLLPEMKPETLAKIIQGEEVDSDEIAELKMWYTFLTNPAESVFAPKEGINPNDFAQAGWGALFAWDVKPEVREALKPLLERRKKQAGARYHEYLGGDGVRAGESKNAWLERHGAGPGPVDPEAVPYYLLLVGSPAQIPYTFQSQLDVQYGVGRICFDTLEEYENYARSVVEAEEQEIKLPRSMSFMGVKNDNDIATQLSADQLVSQLVPIVKDMGGGWALEPVLDGKANKAAFCQRIGGADTPALLFSASHGMGFPNGDPRQLPHQGALLTQDWPGPKQWKQPIGPDFYFSADDLTADAKVWGMMAFFFACYGVGTPLLDNFAQQAFKKERAQIAPYPFISRLPQRMLSHPNGGALAVIGHVERSWGYSFIWGKAGRQLAVYESTIQRLLEGSTVGWALEWFNQRYAELSSDLSTELEEIQYGKKPVALELAGMWTANNDARNFIVFGDPAVRLMPAPKNGDKTAVQASIPLKPTQTTAPGAEAQSFTPAPDGGTGGAPQESKSEPEQKAVEIPTNAGQVQYGVVEDIGSALKTFSENVGAFLNNAVQDLTTLRVCTYTSSEIDKVDLTPDGKELTGGALRAITYVKVDGDTLVCVPEEDGQVDQVLWNIHLDMVKQAQASRTELVRAAIDAVSKLVKPGGQA